MPIEARIETRGIALVLKSLRNADARVMSAAATGLRRGLDKAVTVIQREYLQGPRPERLGEVTTRLRGSINYRVDEEAERIVGRVGTNVKYAAYHEYGFRGTVNVRPHARVISQTSAKGLDRDTRRPIKDKQGNIIGYKESRRESARRQKTGTVGIQFVQGHTRTLNYGGRPFVRPGVRKSVPIILEEIKRAVARVGRS
jgi:phage gpG-like protein